MTNQSQLLFPIITPQNNTVNEVDESGDTVYENIRMQFLLTKSRGWTERDIAQTIHLYLESDLCTDKITGHDGDSFQMVNNNSESPFLKLRRVYKLQDEFISRVVDIMQANMMEAFDASSDNDTRTILLQDKYKLDELKAYYLQHDNTLRLLSLVSYLC
jgi:hypothetical protein